MSSDPVDDLLGALDRALDVQPAPQALARTRAAIEADRGRSGVTRWWRAVAACTAVAAAGAAWIFTGGAPNGGTREVHVSAPASRAAPPDVARAAGTQTDGRALDTGEALVPPSGTSRPVTHARGEKRAMIAAAAPEAAVVVSPEVKAGLDQLARALASGRLLPASFDSEPETFEPLVIVPTIVNPAVVGADAEESGGGSASPNGQFNGPPGRTGSLL